MAAVPARAYLASLEPFGIKLGLAQIQALLTALDRPDEAYPAIVVGGTNGKGSVAAMIERGLRAAGYRTGRYTSPHLVTIEERVALDGDPVPPAVFDAAAERVRVAAGTLAQPPTFFEATTALALDVFREARVDVAVLEVGLGGRLDATNAVAARAVAMAAVDFDHEAHLGRTLEAIATEKAGLIKRNGLAVIGPNPGAVRRVMDRAADEAGATILHALDEVEIAVVAEGGRRRVTIRTPAAVYRDVPLALPGQHQVDNAVTAVRLLEALAASGTFDVPPDAIRTALSDVSWPARLESIAWRGGSVLIDGAHNPAGAAALSAYVEEICPGRVPVVFGVMRDKRADAMLAAIVPVVSHLVVTAPSSGRALPPAELEAVAHAVAPLLPVVAAPTPSAALELARPLGDPVVVAGSRYLAGDVRALLTQPATERARPGARP
jgi:dihydrofolate synthase/folylpolyglutamate synthase